MHAPYDRSRKSGYRGEPKEGLGFLILIAAVPFVLITLAILQPKASAWISQAAEAEFGAGSFAADMPVQTAEPGMAIPMRTVDAY
jgi:hypothetical protein